MRVSEGKLFQRYEGGQIPITPHIMNAYFSSLILEIFQGGIQDWILVSRKCNVPVYNTANQCLFYFS